ncbi:DNA primase [Bordetella pertussis]|nr:DNA primase [Bordetella pertussis]CFO79194.1 DNA primase [Bordetella pertussis]CFU91821.1 DNA primase [Bordetella pertussis]CPI68267.1 DNA primase [Bordetella pertussis]CPL23525.1 DNA primase [Bordetella pertussis]
MAKLAESGLATDEARRRYLELSSRIMVLKNAGAQ